MGALVFIYILAFGIRALWGLGTGKLAEKKGKSFWRWFWIGACLGLIGLIIAACIQDESHNSGSDRYIPEEKKWKCTKCGCEDNSEISNNCKQCGAARYSYDTLDVSQKIVLQEYIDLQLKSKTLDESLELQKKYFDTMSLSYLTFLVPYVQSYFEIEKYKTALKKVIPETE